MVWIRNNTFLAGFLACMIVGIGGLGYLLFDSMGRYDQVSQEYDAQVRELKRLQALEPYPDPENLSKYEDVKTGYKQAVDDLQAKMAGFEPPPENPPITPTQFQDRLRKVVDDVTKAAAAVNVAYPLEFYMGFDRYRNTLPEAGATSLLASELDNVQELVSILIKERVDTIGSVKLATLPQEGGAVADPAAQRAKGGPAVAGQTDLVTKVPLVLEFSGPPSSFRAALNDITHSKRLFIVRAVQVKNEMDKGPVRGQEPTPGGNNPSAPAPAAPGTDLNTGGASEPLPEKSLPPLRYVLGQEKLNVTARIEMAKVAPAR